MREDYWINPFGRDYPPGASQELIDQVELRLGVKLPEDYLKAMRWQNGGWLRYRIYRLPDPPSTPHIPPADPPCYEEPCYLDLNQYGPLEELIPLRIPHEAGWNIQVEGLDLLIAFPCGASSFWCFDYRQSGPQGEPSITFIDQYQYTVPAIEQPVASSFKISSKEVHPETYGQ